MTRVQTRLGTLPGVVEQDGSIATYGYDALYRMTSEARTGTQAHSITYQYDLAGNITQKNGSSFGTYDDANKMTQISGSSFSPVPDADGNQRQIKSNGYPFTSTTLTYDSRNKLVTADTGTPEWAYRYDGFGRRVYRQNHITTPTSRRYYIYAGDTIIGEIDDGVPTVAYTVGPDGVASRRLLAGTPSSRFYCYGPQGETRNLTDEFQAVTSTYFYEAYGKPLGTAPTEYNPYRYGGKFGYYTDSEIQALQVGARWYSPHLIRWMSRDPIHYRGGDNLSAYVMGNPVKYVDPRGLAAVDTVLRLASTVAAGFGDGITFGTLPYARGWLDQQIFGDSNFSQSAIDKNSWTYAISDFAGGSVSCSLGMSFAARGAAELASRYKSVNLLINRGRWIRIGPGRMPSVGSLPPGPNVPRLSIGSTSPRTTSWLRKLLHQDLRFRPLD